MKDIKKVVCVQMLDFSNDSPTHPYMCSLAMIQ